MPQLKLTVRGKVQGVGFRWFVRETARRANLSGWVRNLEDGAVQIVAAGPVDALERLVSAVRRGPPNAQVESVDRQPVGEDSSLPAPFTVLR
jgi:acylphosphatase